MQKSLYIEYAGLNIVIGPKAWHAFWRHQASSDHPRTPGVAVAGYISTSLQYPWHIPLRNSNKFQVSNFLVGPVTFQIHWLAGPVAIEPTCQAMNTGNPYESSSISAS